MSDCIHVYGPYFRRVPFKLYWLKCYKCGSRLGPYLRQESVKTAHHKLLRSVEEGKT